MTTTVTAYGVCEERPLAIEELDPQLRRAAAVFQDPRLLLWRPAPEIAGDVPTGLGIAFVVVRDSAGNRRFVPRDGHGPYIQYGWAAGLAILCRNSQLPPEARFSYRFMKLVFDRARGGREHLGRGFNASRDLYVRPTGRGGGIGSSLLPDCVGRTVDGGGRAWSIRELTERGRQAAAEDGVANPSSDLAIRYGLTAAAEMNPLYEPDPDRIRGLVLAALFDAGESPRQVTDADVDDVTDRLCAAVEGHQDDVWERFEAWFSGEKSNLVKSLAKKSGYSVLDREVVKAALLKLGLRSYEYVASCLSLFAQAVRQSLAEPLNAIERRQFDAMYLPQAAFGGLPLVLLLERSDMIRLVVRRLWENADDERLVAALHRLLAIYGELAPARRAADRRFKALMHALQHGAEPHWRGREKGAKTVDTPHDRLLAIVTGLIQCRGDGCPECQDAAQWDLSLDPQDERGARVTVVCEQHGFEREYELTTAELRSEAARTNADADAD